MPRTYHRSTSGLTIPPKTIFYAPGVAGKTGPFYATLRGIRSAAKTCSRAQWHRYSPDAIAAPDTRSWRGSVTWTEIDLDTGHAILDPIHETITLLIWHLIKDLEQDGHGFESGLPITAPATTEKLIEFHDRDHADPRSIALTHVHREEES